jgi:hypothetical protein
LEQLLVAGQHPKKTGNPMVRPQRITPFSAVPPFVPQTSTCVEVSWHPSRRHSRPNAPAVELQSFPQPKARSGESAFCLTLRLERKSVPITAGSYRAAVA